MRAKERIPIFLDKVNWNKLAKRWKLDISAFDYIRPPNENVATAIVEYWNENPNQRFGQVLINLGLIPDTMRIWLDEENEILKSQGVPEREFRLWGQNYDKDMNQLPKTIWKPIMELSTDHIKAILDGDWTKGHYAELFKEELILRKKSIK